MISLVNKVTSKLQGKEVTDKTEPQSVVQQKTHKYPIIWDDDQISHFNKLHPWLTAKDGCLGCKVCPILNTSKLPLRKRIEEKAVRGSSEWISCIIKYNGKNRQSQLASLRKKMMAHATSRAHESAIKLEKERDKHSMRSTVDKLNSRAVATTEVCFNTAYKMAKCGRPFVDYRDDCILQAKNGLDTGRILHSNAAARNIMIHISVEMRKELISSVLKSNHKISVMLDESTTLSTKAALIIYIRTIINESPITFFLDLVELKEGGTAEAIKNCLLKCLSRHGFSHEILVERWIGFTTDGCSTMLGKSNGLHAIVKVIYPEIISWHCSAHRLELAVNDSLKAVISTNHFSIFLSKLHNVFSMSTKNQRELHDVAFSLNEEIMKIGAIFNIRWVASSLRTVKAVWNSYNALAAWFLQASNDTSRGSKERSTFTSLHTHLTSEYFVANLALMYDCLDELASLSLALQSNSITIIEAHNKVVLARQALEALKDKAGVYESKIPTKFSIVQLRKHVKGSIKIPRAQFIQAIIDSIDARMFCNITSEKDLYGELINHGKILDKSGWSEENIGSPVFADDSVRYLCEKLGLDKDGSMRSYVDGFREFVRSGGKENDASKHLKATFATLAVSSAECERGFRAMNAILTKQRASLLLESISANLFIYIVGPPLVLFNPRKYVISWLRSGRHSAIDQSAKEENPKQHDKDEKYHIWKLFK